MQNELDDRLHDLAYAAGSAGRLQDPAELRRRGDRRQQRARAAAAGAGALALVGGIFGGVLAGGLLDDRTSSAPPATTQPSVQVTPPTAPPSTTATPTQEPTQTSETTPTEEPSEEPSRPTSDDPAGDGPSDAILAGERQVVIAVAGDRDALLRRTREGVITASGTEPDVQTTMVIFPSESHPGRYVISSPSVEFGDTVWFENLEDGSLRANLGDDGSTNVQTFAIKAAGDGGAFTLTGAFGAVVVDGTEVSTDPDAAGTRFVAIDQGPERQP